MDAGELSNWRCGAGGVYVGGAAGAGRGGAAAMGGGGGAGTGSGSGGLALGPDSTLRKSPSCDAAARCVSETLGEPSA